MPSPFPMHVTQRMARAAGALYLLQMSTGIYGYAARGSLKAPGDPATTAERLIAGERLFRLSVAADVVTYLAVATLIGLLYALLRDVNRNIAVLALLFRGIEIAILSTVTVILLGAHRLLSDAEAGVGSGAGQFHTLFRLAEHIHGLGLYVGFIFLGVGSTTFAYLLLRSRFVPVVLAVWGMFASSVLASVTFAILVFPALGPILGLTYMMPMGVYEVGLGLWLLIFGIRASPDGRANPAVYRQGARAPSAPNAADESP